jgi:heme-degrading monooxygenase HmoA
VEEHFVWVTTRRLRPGALEEFEKAWRPAQYPQGMRRAFAYWSEDGQEITGVSFWESKEACDSWRTSEPEAQRRAAMAPYVIEEREGFYHGRELAIPNGSRG